MDEQNNTPSVPHFEKEMHHLMKLYKHILKKEKRETKKETWNEWACGNIQHAYIYMVLICN